MSELSVPEQVVRHARILLGEVAGAGVVALAIVVERSVSDKPVPSFLGYGVLALIAGAAGDSIRRVGKIFELDQQIPTLSTPESNHD